MAKRDNVLSGIEEMANDAKSYIVKLVENMFGGKVPPTVQKVYSHLRKNAGKIIKSVEARNEIIFLKLKHNGKKSKIFALAINDFANLLKGNLKTQAAKA